MPITKLHIRPIDIFLVHIPLVGFIVWITSTESSLENSSHGIQYKMATEANNNTDINSEFDNNCEYHSTGNNIIENEIYI